MVDKKVTNLKSIVKRDYSNGQSLYQNTVRIKRVDETR